MNHSYFDCSSWNYIWINPQCRNTIMDRLNTLWFMFWVWSASPPDDDNAPSHSRLIVTEFLAKHEAKVIAQSPYSPDLAPCDFFLFPKLKYPFWGTRHESNEAMRRNSLQKLMAIPAEAYKKCMENWINRVHACIGSKGAYFEGDNKDLY